tara:strand:+ start:5223 stop:5540 length:318 start_codon:yes stop_codon:yes gene_type:complete
MKKISIVVENNSYYIVNNDKEEFWKLCGYNFGERYWKGFYRHPYIANILMKKKNNKRKLEIFWKKNTEDNFNTKILKILILEKEEIERKLEYEAKKYEKKYENKV